MRNAQTLKHQSDNSEDCHDLSGVGGGGWSGASNVNPGSLWFRI